MVILHSSVNVYQPDCCWFDFEEWLRPVAALTKFGKDGSGTRAVQSEWDCLEETTGCKRVHNTELLPQLSCYPNTTQNALRKHQLAHPGHGTLFCNALLWPSVKHGLSCMILHVVEHVTKGLVTSSCLL